MVRFDVYDEAKNMNIPVTLQYINGWETRNYVLSVNTTYEWKKYSALPYLIFPEN